MPERIKDGTRLTIEEVKRQGKPHLIISLMSDDAIGVIREWLYTEDIKILNVAGPRESNSPGIHLKACDLFRELFRVVFLN